MRSGAVIALPPGSGKTRYVWKKILRGTDWETAVTRIKSTIVVTPRVGVIQTWIDELYICLRVKFPKETSIFHRSDELYERIRPRIFSITKPPKAIRGNFEYLVIDEFHRLTIRSSFLLGSRLNSRMSESPKFYFVSATPINPVENDNASLRDVSGDDCYEEALSRAEDVSLIKIANTMTYAKKGFSGRTYREKLKSMGLDFEVESRSWNDQAAPSPMAEYSGLHRILDLELPIITECDSIISEYCKAVGLISTRYIKKGKAWKIAKRKNKCFIHPYSVLHTPNNSNQFAISWLKKQPRFLRLLLQLESEGILSRSDPKKPWIIERKFIIFCCYQGVARGLYECLKSVISPNYKDAVWTNVITHTDKNSRTRRTHISSAIPNFNKAPEDGGNIQIMVLTDAVSESYSLHRNCKDVVHYELPWSPIRLYQRVGRLTRLIENNVLNTPVKVAHVMIPGSVEEERVNRLLYRMEKLTELGLLPGKKPHEFLLGSGPSLVLKSYVAANDHRD